MGLNGNRLSLGVYVVSDSRVEKDKETEYEHKNEDDG